MVRTMREQGKILLLDSQLRIRNSLLNVSGQIVHDDSQLLHSLQLSLLQLTMTVSELDERLGRTVSLTFLKRKSYLSCFNLTLVSPNLAEEISEFLQVSVLNVPYE